MAKLIVAIHQPHYLPYPGYFDKWDRADLFVLLDHVAYSRSGWQNRNYIAGRPGPVRLSVPVHHAPHPGSIRDRLVADLPPWRRKHRATIQHSYGRSEHLSLCDELLAETYDPARRTLGAINTACVVAMAKLLGISTPWVSSSELGTFTQSKTLLLTEICHRVGADAYLSGDGSAVYLDEAAFERAEVELVWQNYIPPSYPQSEHAGGRSSSLSTLDLIMNTGLQAGTVLRAARNAAIGAAR